MKLDLGSPATLAALVRGDIANALVASTPGGIEAQEARGQAMLVQSDLLPIDLSPSREAFERVGFVFGEPEDELFVRVTLPSGWARAAGKHQMWSTIRDGLGRERVGVFYKAAFYDRRSDARLVPRFTVNWLLPGEDDVPEGTTAYAVKDVGKIIMRWEPVPDHDYPAAAAAELTAKAWLAERYPRHEDPTAYWDDP